MFATQLHVKRVVQWDAHSCGLAAAVMLAQYAARPKKHTYEQILRMSGLTLSEIEQYGARVDQMGKLVRAMLPEHELWVVENSSIATLALLVMCYRIPVGVSWQGIFVGGNPRMLKVPTDMSDAQASCRR